MEEVAVLELFSGTESFSKEARAKGYRAFTVDFDASFNPDYATDIMEFDPGRVPFRPTIIWASPPCQCFSVAAIGRNWNKDGTPKREEARHAMEVVAHTIEIINYFSPKYWYLENPRGMLRKLAVVRDLPVRRTVTYCQYGDTRMKPTDIWTNNMQWNPRPACSNGDDCHEAAPRGARTGTQGLKGAKARAVVPPELCRELLEFT